MLQMYKKLIARYFQRNKMILYGLLAGVIYWLLESAIHSFLWAEKAFPRELLYPGATESLLRVVVIGSLVSLGTYAQRNLKSRMLAEKMTALTSRELDQIFNASVDSMCLINRDWKIFRVNTCYCFMADTLDENIIGRKCHEVFEHSLCHTSSCPLPLILDGVQLVETDVVKEYPDGNERYFLMTATPFLGDDGKIRGIVEQFKDITERKKAEEALKESEKRYATLVDISPDAIAVYCEGKILFTNPAAQNLLGATGPDQLLGKSVMDFIHPDYRNTVAARIEQMKTSGKYAPFLEEKFLRLDGSTVDVEVTSVPFFYQGKPAYMSIAHDIDERKKAEKALQESNERYSSLVELSPDAIIVQKNGKILFVNKIGMKMLGADSHRDIIGKSSMDFIHPDYRDEVMERLKVMASGEHTSIFQEKFIRLDGGQIEVEVSSEPILYDGSYAIQSVVRDITERKKAEKSLKESEKRYRLLAENAGDVIWTMDLNLQFTYMSPSVFNLRGITPEEAMKESLPESLTPKSYKNGMEVFRRELARENDPDMDLRRSITIELEMYHRDGSTIWTENKISPIRDENEKLIEILGVTRDISDRKKAEIFLNRQRDLGIELSAARDLQETLWLCLKTAIQLSGLDSGGIYLVDQESGELRLACFEGLSSEFVESISYYSADSHNVRLVMDGAPVYLDNLDLGLPLFHAETKEGLQAAAMIPILHENNVIACMNVASHTMREIPQRERFVLETITMYIGSTIARRQTEDALRKSEERFRSLVQNSQDLIFSIDSEMVIRYASPSAERTLGYPADSIIGKNLMEYINQEDSDGLKTVLAYAAKNPCTPFPVEFRLCSRDGSWMFSEGTAINLLDQSEVQGIVVNIRDATERRRAEEILRGAAEQWRATFDSMSDAVMLIDLDHRIIRANQAVSDLLGLSFSKLLGRNCHQCVHKTDSPPGGCLHDKALSEKKPNSDERYIPWMDKHFYVTTSPFFDEKKMLAGTVHVMRDITNWKKLEARLMHSERLAAVGEIAAGIAHEIKNPIFAISSGIQILESELELDREQRETFRIIFNETMRVDGLIRQLTEYGAKSDLRRSLHKLDLLINEVIYLNRGLLQAKGVAIETDLPEDMPAVSIDRNKITQVMLNLIQNAIDASGKGDVIEVEAKNDASNRNIILVVTDQGPGIPGELYGKIFDPFFSTKKDNLGMGLAISKKIIMDHGGEISVDSTTGRGTTFRVVFPIEEEADA